MKILGPTRFHRLNEAGGLVYLFTGFFLILCLISYHPQDPSWNSVISATRAHNLTGLAGSYIADFCFQLLGLSAFSLPVLLWLLAWKWIRSADIQAAGVKVFGSVKFEEFNVLGSVVQINPGPVVTTFEFKPEAGIKYSRITNLTEDLCLGLQAESILIERIPGKPTVGIEVPNTQARSDQPARR
jgi:DNA segregation ATPase FtsK/SpoIIIE-like protein